MESSTDNAPVFLSYERSDYACCIKLKQALETAKITCWLDTEAIAPGGKWLEELPKALAQARAMIILWGAASANSPYMEREFHAAEKLQLRIIPVIAEGQELPFHLTDRNAIFLEQGWDSGITQLIAGLTATPNQRQSELAWLHSLQQDLYKLYTPLAGDSRQRQKKFVTIPRNAINQGLFEHLAQRVAKDLPEQQQTYADIQAAFRQVPRAVLLGEPGAGKTTALHKLASDSLTLALNDPTAPIPLWVALGEWREARQPFAAYLTQKLGALAAYLPALLQTQRGILLLDGLNETPTDLRSDKAMQIKDWLQQEPQQRIACYVSCRDLDYAALDLGLDILRIRPLDPLRIRAFIHAWFNACPAANPDTAEQLFWELAGGEPVRQTWLTWERAGASEQQFWGNDDIPRADPNVYSQTSVRQDELWRQAVHNPRSLLKLAANPFMLSMLIVVYSGQEALPENRSALFADFVDILLTREQLADQRTRLLSGLKGLAWAMQQQNPAADWAVQTTLPRSLALTHVDGQTLTQAARANLLDTGDDIRFSHQLLQEYFTALTMADKLANQQLPIHSLWPAGQFW
ncbi:NACHT domain-containing protein [Methylovulum psychrotolerans]|uniref:TIR domain-containing protein n=1 Tax=Methylovulum psychrotolerans TaxID=1704499 RepID=A0A1Z4C3A0_9GAMM|nr:TIR domain-containing protein [Methylovulum psychrotolerans]ASF47991.1 hypothetical protein CEK71_19035 [Methylovulum psychrotolerans]